MKIKEIFDEFLARIPQVAPDLTGKVALSWKLPTKGELPQVGDFPFCHVVFVDGRATLIGHQDSTISEATSFSVVVYVNGDSLYDAVAAADPLVEEVRKLGGPAWPDIYDDLSHSAQYVRDYILDYDNGVLAWCVNFQIEAAVVYT